MAPFLTVQPWHLTLCLPVCRACSRSEVRATPSGYPTGPRISTDHDKAAIQTFHDPGPPIGEPTYGIVCRLARGLPSSGHWLTSVRPSWDVPPGQNMSLLRYSRRGDY